MERGRRQETAVLLLEESRKGKTSQGMKRMITMNAKLQPTEVATLARAWMIGETSLPIVWRRPKLMHVYPGCPEGTEANSPTFQRGVQSCQRGHQVLKGRRNAMELPSSLRDSGFVRRVLFPRLKPGAICPGPCGTVTTTERDGHPILMVPW